jgi:hypothetical protein
MAAPRRKSPPRLFEQSHADRHRKTFLPAPAACPLFDLALMPVPGDSNGDDGNDAKLLASASRRREAAAGLHRFEFDYFPPMYELEQLQQQQQIIMQRMRRQQQQQQQQQQQLRNMSSSSSLSRQQQAAVHQQQRQQAAYRRQLLATRKRAKLKRSRSPSASSSASYASASSSGASASKRAKIQ